MEKKILSIFVCMLLIAVVLPAAGELNVSIVKEQCNPNEGIPTVVFENSPTMGDTGITLSNWSIVATYPIPEGASGLAYDGTYLYCGIYGANGDRVYQIDPITGSYSLLFTGPQGDAFGLTYDGTYLWTTDHPGSGSIPAVAMQLDWDGDLISQFDLPDHYMSGIAYDEGDFWVATYYDPDGQIYKVDNEGNVITQFPAPDDQPWGLCLENENLWMADYWGDALYKIDPSTGDLLESHASEGVDPAGIVWDGEYLWYCDNGEGYDEDYLYKVDLGGALNCGDVNNDGVVELGDIVYLINYLFRAGPVPVPYECVGDVNNDNVVALGDVVYLINYLFRAGPPPNPYCCTPPWKAE